MLTIKILNDNIQLSNKEQIKNPSTRTRRANSEGITHSKDTLDIDILYY